MEFLFDLLHSVSALLKIAQLPGNVIDESKFILFKGSQIVCDTIGLTERNVASFFESLAQNDSENLQAALWSQWRNESGPELMNEKVVQIVENFLTTIACNNSDTMEEKLWAEMHEILKDQVFAALQQKK